jgi:uncharacterized protein YcbK (DUF882 family)
MFPKLKSRHGLLEKSLKHTSRRKFVKGLAAASGVLLLSPWERLLAKTDERKLNFYHMHTGEKLSVIYYTEGGYLNGSMQEIEYFLRDFRTDETHPIDPKLLDLLSLINESSGKKSTFEVFSGYRSPKTNNMLRHSSNGVAKRSLHMQGKAVDIRLRDVRTADIKKIATTLKQGGVGHYKSSDFVHLDTGRFRIW